MHNMGLKWLNLNSTKEKLSLIEEFHLISKTFIIMGINFFCACRSSHSRVLKLAFVTYQAIKPNTNRK